jgi:hypothetical protein
LHPSDFTEAFSQLAHRYWTSTELARRNGVAPSEYDRHGLIRAYETSYVRLTHFGLARVADVVYQFRDASGAEWFISRLQHIARSRKYHSFRFNVVLGDQLYAYVFHPTFNGLLGTEYIVYYRRGATVVSFIGAGQRGTVDSAELVPFVGSVDRRTKAAY